MNYNNNHIHIDRTAASELRGNFREITEKFQGNYRKISGKLQRNFREITKKFQGNYTEISGKLHRNFREITEKRGVSNYDLGIPKNLGLILLS